MTRALLYDATLCIGCKQCEEACAQKNSLPYDSAIAEETRTSEHKFTTVLTAGDEKFMRKLCMHCEDPSCASVCPVGALYKTAWGPVLYDADKCMGCRYCMVACPFGVPKYEWNAVIPRVRKCIMCPDLTAAGKATSCSDACPTGATISGDRGELLAEARKRIRDNPGQYMNHLFGEREVGGTSVFLLSPIPFEKFGFKPDYDQEAMPLLTHQALSKIPDITSLGFVLLGGIYWITNRRNDVAAVEREEKRHREPRDEGGAE
ncbi:MAG: 4Fe-4S dicluster domain-containing protein [Thermoanaerobaculia bacterium]